MPAFIVRVMRTGLCGCCAESRQGKDYGRVARPGYVPWPRVTPLWLEAAKSPRAIVAAGKHPHAYAGEAKRCDAEG